MKRRNSSSFILPPSSLARAASVHARLLNRSRETGEDFQFLLHRYAGERFLYRLGKSTHRQQYVLKGAMLFSLWGGSAYRPTRDLDFAGYGENAAPGLVTIFREICAVAVEDDGLIFNTETMVAEPIRDETEYQGLRVTFKAALGNARIDMQVDVGFGNAIEPPAQEVEYPVLLDAPAPHIRAYPHEAVVAEKLHALVILGERTSRMKDFYDLHALSIQFSFDGATLAQAITATFRRRRTTIEGSPVALTPRFYANENRAGLWRGYLKRNNLPGASADFGLVGELIMNFLNPIWQTLTEKVEFSEKWDPRGPWRKTEGGSNKMNKKNKTSVRKFKPYPAYKPAGIEWLEEIPAHWEIKRLKNIAQIRVSNVDKKSVEGQESVRLCNYVDVYYNERILADMDFMQATATQEQVRQFSLKAGDVLITKDSESWTDIAVSAVVAESIDGVLCGYHLAQITPKPGSNGAFLARVFTSIGPRDQFQIAANGITRYGLSKDAITTGLIPKPPIEEQIVIADFLTRETKMIDALVAKNERLIEKLQERRAGLITHAVTKGLDATMPMKNSGIDWLGKIPAHWEVKKIKRLCLVKREASPRPIDDPIYFDVNGEYAWVRIADVTASDRYLETTTQRLSSIGRSKSVSLEPGELFLSIAATVGKPIITKIKCCIHDGFVYFVGLHENRDYLYYIFSCGEPYRGLGKLGTQLNLNSDTIGDIHIPIPPRFEQEAIANFLDSVNGNIDSLVKKIREVIARLKERRIALISAAVTGKIDVREEMVRA